MTFGVPISKQILTLLADGEKTTKELYEAVGGKRNSIDKALGRLLKAGKIERIAHGLYCLKVPDTGAGGDKNKNFLPKLDTFNDKLKVKSWEHWTRAERNAYYKALMWEVLTFACQRIDDSVIGEKFISYSRVVQVHNILTDCAETAEIHHFPFFRLLTDIRDTGKDPDEIPLIQFFKWIYGENSDWVEGEGFREEAS